MMADHGRDGGGASWKLNIYWLPERSLELDPFRCFANRLQRVVAAKRETAALLAGCELPRFVCADARGAGGARAGRHRARTRSPTRRTAARASSTRSCPRCGAPGSIRRSQPAHDAEIGENPHRGRDRDAFAPGWLDGFRAVHRALAPGARMTVTFASRDPRSWQALDAALAGAGFRVDEQVEMGRSAPGLTERTSPGRPAPTRGWSASGSIR